jgi:hypothetical protein
MRHIFILFICAGLLAACDKRPGDNKQRATTAAIEPETTQEPQPETTPAPEPKLTDAEKEAREKTFGTFVEGADLVKVGRTHFEAGSKAGASKSGVTQDPDVIASLVAAIGPGTMTDDVPSRCQPTHYISFFKGEDKLKAFKIWCENSDALSAVYIEDRQYTPIDPKTAGKMVNGILDGTYAE